MRIRQEDLYRFGLPFFGLFLLLSVTSQADENAIAVSSTTPSPLSFIEPLSTPLTFPNGGSAIGLAQGDFNGDSKLDLAVTQESNSVNPGPAFVSILLGNGDGTFRTPTNIPIFNDPNLGGLARGIVAKDFDHNGIFDLVVDVGEQRKILFFKGRGDGTFNDPTSFNTVDHSIEVQAADLNGDGNLDVVALNALSGDHSISVLLGNGDGTFKSATTYSTNMQPQSLGLADVDGQNRADIVIACYGDGNNQPSVDVLLNNGSGTFPAVTTKFTQRFQVTGLYAADFDGDSKVDIAATGFGGPTDRSLVFIKGNGDGTFVSPPDQNFQAVEDLPVGSSRFADSTPPDLDGDGRPDVLITHGGNLNIVTVGLGRGDGHFNIKELVASNGPGFPQDRFGNPPPADGNSTNTAIAGDFNGDGKQDLAIASQSGNGTRPGGVSIILGTGQGNFLAPRGFSMMGGTCFCYVVQNGRSSSLGDFNGDGKLDLITLVSGPDGHIAEVLPGNADGTFAAAIAALGGTSGLGTGVSALRVADMNRDGKLDVIVTSGPAGVQGNQGTTATRIAYGTGTSTFTYAAALPPLQQDWSIPNVVVADINKDGAPDLAVLTGRGSNPRQQHIDVFIQNPNQPGSFTNTTGFPQTDLGQNNSDGLVAADFDRDGRVDLIAGGGGTATSAPNQVMFLRGNGDGTFRASASVGPIILGNAVMFDLRALDLNNDGKLDLLATGFGGVSVYLGNGNGNFQPPVSYSSGGGGSPTSDIVDVDHDGIPDVAFGNGDSNTFTVLRGHDDGTFAAPVHFAIGYAAARGIDSGDLNGDGKPDIVALHEMGVEKVFATVLINNSPSIQFSSATYVVNEGTGDVNVTVTRTGDTSGPVSVDFKSVDSDTFTVPCNDTVNTHGAAYARCDFATVVGNVTFAAGEVNKTVIVPIIDDVFVEGPETFQLVLSNSTGANLGVPNTTTITIQDNDTVGAANPIFSTPFFVRQHYLDFLSREPETAGFNAWVNVLNNCSDVNNNPTCDRLTVSADFFGSQEFQLKGFYVFRFYKLAFNRLPQYSEIIPDMSFVAGATATEVFARKAQLATNLTQRQEFLTVYGSLTNNDFVSALMNRYQLTQITTPDPANPDGINKITLTNANLVNSLSTSALTRAQVLRAIADSDQVQAAEFNNAFVAMQYYGYLRRTPETAGYNAWLAYLSAHPTDFRTMVNGFMNSSEYRLRFGPP